MTGRLYVPVDRRVMPVLSSILRGYIMFHCQNGLYFNRLKSGSVRIIKTDNGKLPQDGGMVIMEEIIGPSQWCSVIAHLSEAGETAGKYQEALKFHES